MVCNINCDFVIQMVFSACQMKHSVVSGKDGILFTFILQRLRIFNLSMQNGHIVNSCLIQLFQRTVKEKVLELNELFLIKA